MKLTGVDLSPAMLDIARMRAGDLDRHVDLREGDAHQLTFDDETFDTVVCTFSLCNIPDLEQAVTEMTRVLRPGGRLVLVDHIRSSVTPIFWLQKGIEVLSVRIDGDRMTRRPADVVEQLGFQIVERDRFRWASSNASSPSTPPDVWPMRTRLTASMAVRLGLCIWIRARSDGDHVARDPLDNRGRAVDRECSRWPATSPAEPSDYTRE